MRSLSLLSLSFVVASFALAGCAVGSETPDDSTASQEVNGAGETVSVSKDAKRDVPRLGMDINTPKIGDRANVEVNVGLERQGKDGKLGAEENISDVMRNLEHGRIEDGTRVNIDGTLREPGSIIDLVRAAGEGRGVIHNANGNPFDRKQVAYDPITTLGVGGDGDDKP